MLKPEMSNWFSRVRCDTIIQNRWDVLTTAQNDVEPTTIVKKPNPRNMQNTTRLREIEQEVERYDDLSCRSSPSID